MTFTFTIMDKGLRLFIIIQLRDYFVRSIWISVPLSEIIQDVDHSCSIKDVIRRLYKWPVNDPPIGVTVECCSPHTPFLFGFVPACDMCTTSLATKTMVDIENHVFVRHLGDRSRCSGPFEAYWTEMNCVDERRSKEPLATCAVTLMRVISIMSA